MSDVRLYKALRTKLGETEAEELVSFVKTEIENGFMEQKDTFLVKQDKMDIVVLMKKDKEELLSKMKQDKEEVLQVMKQDKYELVNMVLETRGELSKTRFELISLIHKEKTSVLKAIYMVGLTQFLAIITALLLIVNFMLHR